MLLTMFLYCGNANKVIYKKKKKKKKTTYSKITFHYEDTISNAFSQKGA